MRGSAVHSRDVMFIDHIVLATRTVMAVEIEIYESVPMKILRYRNGDSHHYNQGGQYNMY